MNHTTQHKPSRRKRRIERRLAQRRFRNQVGRVPAASNVVYEVADRTLALGAGGIGAIHRMIVLRKKISVEKRQGKLFDEYRYFFHITNDRTSTSENNISAHRSSAKPTLALRAVARPIHQPPLYQLATINYPPPHNPPGSLSSPTLGWNLGPPWVQLSAGTTAARDVGYPA